MLLLHFFFKNVDEQSSFFARLEISTVLAPFGNFYRFAPTKKKKKRRLNKLCFDEVEILLGDHQVGLDHPDIGKGYIGKVRMRQVISRICCNLTKAEFVTLKYELSRVTGI